MLLADALSSNTPITISLVITLIVLGGGIAGGVLTSRLMQGRSLRELEKWRNEKADPELDTLMDEHNYQARREKERLTESASQSTTHGTTQTYKKANR